MRTSSLLLTLTLLATVGCISPGAALQDFDGDGSLDADDCAPGDPVVHPGAGDDFGDGIDQNCDGVDGNAVDQDLDGYSNAVDCDDEDPAVYPGAPDSHGDDIDSNCDGIDGVAVDQDGDGYSNAVDCDDSDPASYPGADDPLGDDIDQDCDGMDGVAADLDGDGYSNVVDCDDLDPTIYPGAVDVFGDGIDQNCDGVDGVAASGDDDDSAGDDDDSAGDDDIIAPEHCADGLDNDLDGDIDCGDADCISAAVCLEHCSDGLDNDLDGVTDCADPDCSVAGICQEDCDDGLDNDLDGDTDCADSSCGSEPFCAGDDDDSGSASGSPDVDDDSDGFSENQGDCDDTDASNFPGNVESCDGQDNDCNGVADLTGEAINADNDSVLACADCDDGDANSTAIADDADCDGVVTANDCDDNAPDTYPGAPDPLDASGLDTNCDLCDPTLPAVVDANGVTHFRGDGIDSDCDGYAQNGVGSYQDCNDSDAAVYPGSSEVWESPAALLDTNCDSDVQNSLGVADYSFVGENGNDQAGYSVSNAGDVDGDGLSDLLIGAPNNGDGGFSAGKAYLILGSSLGASSTIDLSAADYSFEGEDGWDQAGNSVASAGDVDGDGLSDLLIGAPYNDGGGTNGGKAYLILASSLGSSPFIDLSQADYSFVGENLYDYAGYSVSSAGDVDGDTLSDLFIGAWGYADGGPMVGKAYLILASSLGASSTIDLSAADYSFVGETTEDGAGYSVSSAGDVDGDGLSDLLVGAWGDDAGGNIAGKAYLILGSSLGTSPAIDLSLADYSFVGENNGDIAGYSVSSAGDVDGDTLSDLLVGAYLNDDGGDGAGKAYLILGSSLGTSPTIDLSLADYSFVGESGGSAGRSVSSAGDVDGDGLSDLLVGAEAMSSSSGAGVGRAYLILGSNLGVSPVINLSVADYNFLGENSEDHAGYSVSSAGDVDGDGRDDLLVGAYQNDEAGIDAGKAYLLLSPY